MISKFHLWLILLLLTISTCASPQVTTAPTSTTSRHFSQDTILTNLVDAKIRAYPHGVEFALAFIKQGEVEYYGLKHQDSSVVRMDNSQHVFEVGSMTKVFTSHLLMEAVLAGKINIDDPLQQYFSFDLATDSVITLRQLASHSSGLPVMPASFFESGYDESNPYKDFNDKALLDYLARELAVDSSKRGHFSYSNVGIGIIGRVLEMELAQSYAQQLQVGILDPQEMNNSSLDRSMLAKQLVPGVLQSGDFGENWDLAAIAPAGGLYSTTEDIAKYLIHVMEPGHAAFALQSPTVVQRNPVMDQGLGWMIINGKSGKRFYFHAGATGGYSSMMVMEPATKNAVVMLTNIETGENSIDGFAFKLMKELGAQ